MDERQMQFRVGAVVLATFVIGGLLVALNSPGPQSWVPWAKGKYRVLIELNQAPGIAPNTPVRKNGILIGRVSAIEDRDNQVMVTAKVNDGVRLYPDPLYACQVRTSVLGDSTIDFVSRRVPPNAVPLRDGGVTHGTVLANPLDMLSNLQGDLAVMTNSLGHAGDEVAKLAENLNQALGQKGGQQRFAVLLDRTIAALENFSATMHSFEGLFSDGELRDSLHVGLREIPAAVHDVRLTMTEARQTLSGLDDVIVSAERNFANLEGFTEPLGRNGEELLAAAFSAVESVDLLVEEITVLAGTITRSEGTIGQLINDPSLYNNINQLSVSANELVWNLNQATSQLRPLLAMLRPILHDVRVFTDKISREPGRLISGAFNRGAGIK
jgi:phospholipid/cholesterol/gamma-HCH transport system substrate-binding protein